MDIQWMVRWWVLVHHGQAMPIMLAKAWDKPVMTTSLIEENTCKSASIGYKNQIPVTSQLDQP